MTAVRIIRENRRYREREKNKTYRQRLKKKSCRKKGKPVIQQLNKNKQKNKHNRNNISTEREINKWK